MGAGLGGAQPARAASCQGWLLAPELQAQEILQGCSGRILPWPAERVVVRGAAAPLPPTHPIPQLPWGPFILLASPRGWVCPVWPQEPWTSSWDSTGSSWPWGRRKGLILPILSCTVEVEVGWGVIGRQPGGPCEDPVRSWHSLQWPPTPFCAMPAVPAVPRAHICPPPLPPRAGGSTLCCGF